MMWVVVILVVVGIIVGGALGAMGYFESPGTGDDHYHRSIVSRLIDWMF